MFHEDAKDRSGQKAIRQADRRTQCKLSVESEAKSERGSDSIQGKQ
jgi:hypothetical protein